MIISWLKKLLVVNVVGPHIPIVLKIEKCFYNYYQHNVKNCDYQIYLLAQHK